MGARFVDWLNPGWLEIESGLPGVYLDLPEVLFPVRNTIIQSPHHAKIVEVGPFGEVGSVRSSTLNVEEIVKRPRSRSTANVVTDGFKRSQNPLAI